MNRALVRRSAIVLAALLALAVLAGAIFVATFDVNRYKGDIAAAVQARTGRTLTFDGDLGLAIFPRVAVRLPATTVSEPRRKEPFARVQSARASVALLPLLRRQLVVDAVRLDGLQATIVRQKDGRTNVDDLLGTTDEKDAPAAPDAKPQAGATATIGAIELDRADLTFRDLAAGRTVRAHALELRAGRYAAGGRMPLTAKGELVVSEPAIAARVDFAAEFEWDEQGAWRAMRDLAVKADGTLRQQPLRVDARAERLVAAAGAVDVRGARFSAHGKSADGAAIEARFSAPRFEAGPERAGGERIELALTRGGAAPLDLTVVVDGVRGTAAQVEATAVKFAGSARTGGRTVRFDLASALAANLDSRTLRIERAAGEVRIEGALAGTSPVRAPITASAAIDGRRETAAFRFDVRGDGLAGRGRVDTTGFATPRIAFDIDADRIDADRYLGTGEVSAAGTGPPLPAPAGRGAPGAPPDPAIDLGALKELNANGTVRVAELRVRGTDVADLRATVKAAGGRLDIAPLSLRAHGGSLNGRVALDARGNRVAVAGTAAGMQLRQLVGTVGKRAAVEGSANGSFNLAGAGATVGQLKRALAGRVALDVRDGALIGIDLADLLGTAAGFLQSRGRQTGRLDESRRTPFTLLSATVRVADGVATNDDLRAKSPQFDIAGSGRMDLVSTELDYTLRAQLLGGATAERGTLRSLAGVTVPVRITGTVEQPSYAVDWAPIAADALLRRATDRAGVPDVNRVIEGLGDLLRRKK